MKTFKFLFLLFAFCLFYSCKSEYQNDFILQNNEVVNCYSSVMSEVDWNNPFDVVSLHNEALHYCLNSINDLSQNEFNTLMNSDSLLLDFLLDKISYFLKNKGFEVNVDYFYSYFQYKTNFLSNCLYENILNYRQNLDFENYPLYENYYHDISNFECLEHFNMENEEELDIALLSDTILKQSNIYWGKYFDFWVSTLDSKVTSFVEDSNDEDNNSEENKDTIGDTTITPPADDFTSRLIDEVSYADAEGVLTGAAVSASYISLGLMIPIVNVGVGGTIGFCAFVDGSVQSTLKFIELIMDNNNKK